MKVLIIGGGGREHALAWKLAQSESVQSVLVAPGNGGSVAKGRSVPVAVNDFNALTALAKQERVDLTVVGPEDPLVGGIVDHFQREGLVIYGPSRAASRLEGSKAFCRDICLKAGVPMARGEVFTDHHSALDALASFPYPMVIKADGLAAGKGVAIVTSRAEAEAALQRIMTDRVFGAAGDRVVLEECLTGYEVSILAVCSGSEALLFDPIQDHKALLEGDRGPNTGGMGAYSPVPQFLPEQKAWVKERIITPVLEVMRDLGHPYQGTLFAGLMVGPDGDARLLEFNVRFGDPETQAILPRLETDLAPLLLRAARGESLAGQTLRTRPEACVTVVAVSEGYPGEYGKGFPISGLDRVAEEDALVFHAGTRLADGNWVTAGGRVLAVSSLAVDLAAAQAKCYQVLEGLHFEGMRYRRDIGYRAIQMPSPGAGKS